MFAAASLLLVGGASAQDGSVPEKLVDALNGVFGKPQETKSSHAKGVCVTGAFKGAPGASTLTKSAMFSGKEAPATVRFSIGGDNQKCATRRKARREVWLLA